jgi:hypothetical protein
MNNEKTVFVLLAIAVVAALGALWDRHRQQRQSLGGEGRAVKKKFSVWDALVRVIGVMTLMSLLFHVVSGAGERQQDGDGKSGWFDQSKGGSKPSEKVYFKFLQDGSREEIPRDEYCKRLALESLQMLTMMQTGNLNAVRDHDISMKTDCPEGQEYWFKQVNDER